MNDYDDDYTGYDDWEPYFIDEDEGHGYCPDCGSAMLMSGAVSSGDGDIYDETFCPNCGSTGKENVRWMGPEGELHDEYEMWLACWEDAESNAFRARLERAFNWMVNTIKNTIRWRETSPKYDDVPF